MNENGGTERRIGLLLSPFMSCEEAWLLVRFVREVDPEAVLAMGPVPYEGEDQHFPVGPKSNGTPSRVNGKSAARFTILREKCPNRRGIERIIESAGGESQDYSGFREAAESGRFSAAWIVGGYPTPWIDAKLSVRLTVICIGCFVRKRGLIDGLVHDRADGPAGAPT